MLYIVGYWHLFNYTDAFPKYQNALTVRLTVIVLGAFTLVSGYLIGKRPVGADAASILAFYKSKLIRIYPPFAIALFIFFLNDLVTAKTLLTSLTLSAMFWGPPPMTLWYVTMIVVFYVLSPFLLRAKQHSFMMFAGISALIFLSLCTLQQMAGGSDIRMNLYFPCFALGIWISGRNTTWRPQVMPALIILSVLGAWLGKLETQSLESSYFSIPLAAFGALAVFGLCMNIKVTTPWAASALTHLSFASYFMYLSHRPIFLNLHRWYQPSGGWGQIAYLVLICLPVIIAISWALQSLYDRQFTSRGASA